MLDIRLEHRVIEFDGETDLETVKWFKPGNLVAFLDLDWPPDPDM